VDGGGGGACFGVRCVMGRRLWIVSRGSVRTAARGRMGTEREVVDPMSVDMDSQDWRRMEVLVARRRTCGDVVMLFRQKGMRRERRDVCVLQGLKSQ
jgi:hypothetical protein